MSASVATLADFIPAAAVIDDEPMATVDVDWADESTRIDSTVNFSGEQMAAYRERLSKRGKDGAKRGSGWKEVQEEVDERSRPEEKNINLEHKSTQS